MKQEDMMILGVAVVGALLIVKSVKANNAGGALASKPLSKWVAEIFGTDGQSFGNGWRYFDDGTSIAPNGDYYMNGQLVWKAPASLTV